jgi:Fic-DOC domain mobile mystery protein B
VKGLFQFDEAATPLTAEERAELLPTHVSLRGELNELEQANIADANLWAFERQRNVLDETFLRGLHRRMFNRVWRWAGDYRTTGRNIGVAPYEIGPRLIQAIDDAWYWTEHRSYAPDELAVRFHHRLVVVHPFPNGNGRWSRMAADLLVTRQGGNRFNWGSGSLQQKGETRNAYLQALRAAGRHDLGALIAFAIS